MASFPRKLASFFLSPSRLFLLSSSSKVAYFEGRARCFMPAFEDAVRFTLTIRTLCLCLTTCLPLAISGAKVGQGIRPPAVPAAADPSAPPTEPDESERRMARNMAKKANLERQAQLKTDTDKLFRLSQELKEYVDKSNENVLSLSVLRKAEEIEKLARSVKDKMKGPN
jgi:hypothetical protein